jgi:hypothetical protein
MYACIHLSTHLFIFPPLISLPPPTRKHHGPACKHQPSHDMLNRREIALEWNLAAPPGKGCSAILRQGRIRLAERVVAQQGAGSAKLPAPRAPGCYTLTLQGSVFRGSHLASCDLVVELAQGTPPPLPRVRSLFRNCRFPYIKISLVIPTKPKLPNDPCMPRP